uniref:Uncharacterized protein n=1 Tax=Rhizophora mucronata TaxID=61149 RepID=A0A2P2PEE7_RHIMU
MGVVTPLNMGMPFLFLREWESFL